MPKTLGKFAAVAAAATAVVALSGNAATAADAAYNERSVWLNGNPQSSDAPACTSRTIYLASDTYKWISYIDGIGGTASREIYLAAGTYTWEDCMAAATDSYVQTSRLSRYGSASAYLNAPKRYLPAGTYTFGSLLSPQ
ncbi:hypothetical protein [Streptomyces sp. enrichment culture]|uniref:hypothetical protein n=1 Tax=Streptomyces sp. enrichment culture TaxID=1795815 RepID=UPI003F551998